MLTGLRERLLNFTRYQPAHHHLTLPMEHYSEQVRQALFSDFEPRPVQNHALSRDH